MNNSPLLPFDSATELDRSIVNAHETKQLWSAIKAAADRILWTTEGKYLSDIEIIVLQGAWDGQTYEEMAIANGYSAEYLNKDVGNKLWHKLSQALGEKVTKKNFRAALLRALPQQPSTQPCDRSAPAINLPFPEGAVPLDSPFYLQRPSIDNLCTETVTKAGSLIRIKAPKLMGKTSLMNRILAHATQQNYQTVYLDFSCIERSIATHLDKFLRWFCLSISRQLKLENRLAEYWDTEILGSNDNCTAYLQDYLLPAIAGSVVIGLDEVDRLFAYPEVIEDFLGLLRSWHEQGKVSQIWKHLHLVIAHSTEVYVPLDINQSPFNAGLPIELLEFDAAQVQSLAKLHGLDWQSAEIQQLMQAIGGHPYLVQLSMYYVHLGKLTLTQLLQDAATETGIYNHHLRHHLEILRQVPDLTQALQQVVTALEPIALLPMQIYKLHSMGLVQRQGNLVEPRCWLYREYFRRVLENI